MEHYKIPKSLQKPEFRFVKLGEWNLWRNKKTKEKRTFTAEDYPTINKKEWDSLGKAPFEKAWQQNGYKFDDPSLLQHLKDKKNIGLIGGYGKVRIQDIDDEKLAIELINKFNTLTIKTGSGGGHFIIISDLNTNFLLQEELGEFRGKDYQVVCGNMRHPNGEFYKVQKDLPIREIPQDEFLEIVKPYLRNKELENYFGEKKRTTLNGKGELEQSDESRSAFEFRKVIALLREGKTKEQIFKTMETYSKWATAHDAYKELTYSKAAKYVEEQQMAQEEEEKITVMDYRSLMDYKVEPVKWLIKDQIPKGEVGVLAGKRGELKTWIALKQALGLASGKDVFGDEVPEKRRVMIIDDESGENVLSKRLQLLAKADGIQAEELDLISMSFTGLKLDQIGSKKYLEFAEIVESFKPDLIIVDCLQRVCAFDIDKENALISSLFTGAVRPMMKTYGMSWLFIHHLRKSPTGNQQGSGDPLDEIRGGSELVNYCRFVLSSSLPRNQGKQDDGSMMIVFKVLKMSNSNIPEPKVLNFQPDHADPDHNTQIKIEYLGKVEDVLRTEVRVGNAIKEFLLEQQITGEFTTKQVTDEEKTIGFKRTFLGKGLKELVDDGFLEKVKRGVYQIIGEVKQKPKPTLKPKLPYGSSQKTLEEQKKDLVKTEDDINDEIIEEDLRVKKVESLKDNPFCPKCNSPTIKKKEKFVCFDEDCGGIAE